MDLQDIVKTETSRLEKYENYNYSILDKLLAEANRVGKSWSGSFLGYHSRVYYEGFVTPPPGAHFSTEWGIYSDFSSVGLCSVGEWREYYFSEVVEYITRNAGNPDLTAIKSDKKDAEELIEDVKANILSAIHSKNIIENDNFLKKLVSEFETIVAISATDCVKSYLPKGQVMTRDQRVEHKILTPPHKNVECQAYEIISVFIAVNKLIKISSRIIGYLQNLEIKLIRNARIGSSVFIGHGRSKDWRDLKDFINERLGLPWDEFNRVPVAGLTNTTRLAQMLDQACIAFLVMTAEDEQADGNHHARMNVIHEVGLFQGRLGFEKAVVLLEEGCEEFSNIQGLGQIRFPKGNIGAVFEDIRRVLEREEIISGG